MSRVAVLLVALLVLAVSGPAFSQAFDDSAIRPGEAIGPFRLGATYDQVAGVFGRRADGEATEGNLKVYRWNLQGAGHSGTATAPALSVSVNGDNAVEMITTTSTGFATPGGSSVGLSLNAFKEEVRTPYRGYKDSAGVRHLRFDTAGLAVTYDIRGAGMTTVKSIAVFKPAAAMPGPAPAITPGVGIGAARLGMSTDEVIRAMGQAPARRGRAADGRELLIFVLPEKDMFGDNAWVTVYVDRAGAYLITTDAVNHFTAQGNNPGNGILELQAEFGVAFRSEALLTPWPWPLMGIWYEQHGIAGFYFPPDGEKRILWIGVYRRG